jgi:hypothetical protein
MITALLLLSGEVSSVVSALFFVGDATVHDSAGHTSSVWWEPAPVKEIQTTMRADGSKYSINAVW